MTKDKLADIFNLPMMMIASTRSKDSSNAKEAKEVINDYTAISKDAAQAQALGQEAKTLGEQAQAAGKEAAAAADGATAAAKGAEAQRLAAEAQAKGEEAQKLGDSIKAKNDAMPAKIEAARKATKESLGDVGEDSLKTVGIQLT